MLIVAKKNDTFTLSVPTSRSYNHHKESKSQGVLPNRELVWRSGKLVRKALQFPGINPYSLLQIYRRTSHLTFSVGQMLMINTNMV